MTILRRLQEYLDRRHVHYEVLGHEAAYTAPEIAHALHVSEKMLAKVVIVKADGRFVMVALPSNWQIDFKRAMSAWRPKPNSRNCSQTVKSGRCRPSEISAAWTSMWTSPSRKMKQSSFRRALTSARSSSDTKTLPTWFTRRLLSFIRQRPRWPVSAADPDPARRGQSHDMKVT